MMEVFIENNLRLIALEREAEKDENSALLENVSPKELQKQGICLLNLRLGARKSGMFGRTLVSFSPYWADKHLPAHNLTPGDILALSPSHGDSRTDLVGTGVVTSSRGDVITVAFDDFSCAKVFDLDDDEKWKLVKLANEITYKRLKRALEKLRSYRDGPACHLVEVLVGSADRRPPLPDIQDVSYRNCGLNESQREAVRFALTQPDVAVIHGPPGTGKSTTLIEIIEIAAAKMNMKVLACAPSNVAVDNLVLRLVEGGQVRPVRLGHPARVDAKIQRYALDAMVAGSEEKQLARDVRTNIEETMAKLRKSRSDGEKQRLRQEMKLLRKELFQREETATRTILKKANVILATLTSSSDDGPIRLLDQTEGFDLVVIDECSQALEASCWIALLQGRRCILAGDHHQLPPTILSKQAASEGLERTLMERVLSEHGENVMRMLTVQYRMHEQIMRWPSDQLYHGRLEAHPSVADHLLCDLPGVERDENTVTPLLLVDTAGCHLPELCLEDRVSKGNEGEADLVEIHVEALVRSGVPAHDIAVIAPYNLQVDLIRTRLASRHPQLEIKSVDSFQGREKEAVVISLVRSNESGEVGFLGEDRRINVAITRARRHLAVVCDTSTVSRHAFLASLVEYMSRQGDVRTAHLYMHEHDVGRCTVDASQIRQSKPKQTTVTKATVTKATVTKETGAEARPAGRSWEDAKKQEASFPCLRRQVEEFTRDELQTEYQFSTALTKAERKYVHEVCEELGVNHSSHGEDQQRYILISKPAKTDHQNGSESESVATETATETTKTDIAQNVPSKTSQSETNGNAVKVARVEQVAQKLAQVEVDERTTESSQKSASNNSQLCSKCRKSIPKTNIELHELRCQGEQKSDSKSKGAKPKTLDTNIKSTETKKSKNKKLQKSSAIATVDEDDFDALIAAAQTENSVCNFVKCKQSTSIVGQLCKFCVRKYCLRHYIAEAHGCGEAARQAARATVVREGRIYPGSGVPSKKPDPTKRGHLHRKLEEAIDEKQNQRKVKKKENK